MFFNKPFLAGLTAGALALSAAAQPQTPAAPKPLRGGRPVTGRMMSAKVGWLGVGLGELTPERVKALKLKGETGIEVMHVEENSPAAKAGLKEHDVILTVNNQAVEGGEHFARTIADMSPGTKVALTVWRSGGKQNLTATLEARPNQLLVFSGPNGDWMATMPSSPPLPPSGPGWDNAMTIMSGQAPRVGFEGETLTPQLAEFFGVKEGVLVRTVSEKTPAAKAGLKAGDVVIKVSGTPVSSTREITGIIRAQHNNVTFTVMRNHKEIVLNVELSYNRILGSDREVL